MTAASAGVKTRSVDSGCDSTCSALGEHGQAGGQLGFGHRRSEWYHARTTGALVLQRRYLMKKTDKLDRPEFLRKVAGVPMAAAI